MTRPADLPDFDDPPLNEVVVGIQYEPFDGFMAVDLGSIYAMYSKEFPHIEEHTPLEPRIETFGGTIPSPSLSFDFGPAAFIPRLWFVSEKHDHLIQFQEDRFMLNWRKRRSDDRYPHFEEILNVFQNALVKLSEYYSRFEHEFKLTQAELTYVNIIPVSDFGEFSSWLSIEIPITSSISALSFLTEEIMYDGDGNPTGRFFVELNSVYTKDGKERAFRLNLTVRGRPHPKTPLDLSEYLLSARRKIVESFDEMITEEAKNKWGKKWD